jgi:hypothetical protein
VLADLIDKRIERVIGVEIAGRTEAGTRLFRALCLADDERGLIVALVSVLGSEASRRLADMIGRAIADAYDRGTKKGKAGKPSEGCPCHRKGRAGFPGSVPGARGPGFRLNGPGSVNWPSTAQPWPRQRRTAASHLAAVSTPRHRRLVGGRAGPSTSGRPPSRAVGLPRPPLTFGLPLVEGLIMPGSSAMRVESWRGRASEPASTCVVSAPRGRG